MEIENSSSELVLECEKVETQVFRSNSDMIKEVGCKETEAEDEEVKKSGGKKRVITRYRVTTARAFSRRE